jgi:ABC-type Zn2+ transport system substrate-binding protein/surface adhesin
VTGSIDIDVGTAREANAKDATRRRCRRKPEEDGEMVRIENGDNDDDRNGRDEAIDRREQNDSHDDDERPRTYDHDEEQFEEGGGAGRLQMQFRLDIQTSNMAAHAPGEKQKRQLVDA